jgi:hypothetical protein
MLLALALNKQYSLVVKTQIQELVYMQEAQIRIKHLQDYLIKLLKNIMVTNLVQSM